MCQDIKWGPLCSLSLLFPRVVTQANSPDLQYLGSSLHGKQSTTSLGLVIPVDTNKMVSKKTTVTVDDTNNEDMSTRVIFLSLHCSIIESVRVTLFYTNCLI